MRKIEINIVCYTTEALKNKFPTDKEKHEGKSQGRLTNVFEVFNPKPVQYICLQGSSVRLSASKKRNQ